MIPALNSNVNIFIKEEHLHHDDWMASASQQNYHEHIDLEKEFLNINDPKKHWKYFNFS